MTLKVEDQELNSFCFKDEFLTESGILKYLDNDGLIKIPENIKSINIDVGLAGDAPTSALWLSKSDETFVIGVEPLLYHHQHLFELGRPDNNISLEHPSWPIVQMKENCVMKKRQKIADITDRFMLIKCAINNVDNYEKQVFYVNKVGETGSSSLLRKHAESRPHLIDKKIDVDVCSLKHILDFLPWEKIKFIEHIKTDCEGLDFEAVRSLRHYIKKVIFITLELSSYTTDMDRREFLFFMQSWNFQPIKIWNEGVIFANRDYINEIETYNLQPITAGHCR
jgi:hypothetical protein